NVLFLNGGFCRLLVRWWQSVSFIPLFHGVISPGRKRERALSSTKRQETQIPYRFESSVNQPIWPMKLLADAKFLDDALIALSIVLFQIVQQTAALADHHEQTAPGGMVLLVVFEV